MVDIPMTPAARMRERAAKVADEVAEGERALMPPTATERVAMLVHGTGHAVAMEIAAALRALPDENAPDPRDAEIAALRAEVARLRKFAIAAGDVLDQCTGDYVDIGDILPCDVMSAFIEETVPGGEWKDARAALEEPK